MMQLPITPQLFTILAGLIEEQLGLHYAPEDAALLADKLGPRVQELGFQSLLEYYYYLRYDEAGRAELDALADSLVVNETYFHRELDALSVLADLIAVTARQRLARVWCAAASTGEEPYTLAMLLEERGVLDRVRLLASDLSPRALERAAAGKYRGRALRALPDAARARFFADAPPFVEVDPRLRDAVELRRVNLLDDATIAGLGPFDFILCRNVLIYFRDDVVRTVVERLARRLVPGGILLVGTSESLLRLGTSLQCIERGGVFLYQRSEP